MNYYKLIYISLNLGFCKIFIYLPKLSIHFLYIMRFGRLYINLNFPNLSKKYFFGGSFVKSTNINTLDS